MMKSMRLSLIAIVFSADIAQAQTVDSAIAYFPLSIGNSWQFMYADLWMNPPGYQNYLTLDIISDTVMQNGKTYFVRLSKSTYNIPTKAFFRVDSATATVYAWTGSGEAIAETLAARQGDRFGSMTCSEGTKTVFGKVVHVKSFSVTGSSYTLGYGFGPVSTYDEGSGMPRGYILLYSRIGGVQYGTRVSVPIESNTPKNFKLYQNYPNPFNPTTTIRYSLKKSGYVSLTIFSLLGQQLKIIVSARESPGDHELIFNAQDLPSGVYLYRLQSGNNVVTKAMVLAK